MTSNEFKAAWNGATAQQRFVAFVAWVTASIMGYPTYVSPSFQMVSSGGGGDCEQGYVLPHAVFEDAAPESATVLGHAIIAQCSNLAQKIYIEAQRKAVSWPASSASP